MNGTLVADDVARARALGIALRVSVAADRTTDPLPRGWPAAPTGPAIIWPTVARVSAAADPRGPNACPTCEDGLRTIETPNRCRECMRAGL